MVFFTQSKRLNPPFLIGALVIMPIPPRDLASVLILPETSMQYTIEMSDGTSDNPGSAPLVSS